MITMYGIKNCDTIKKAKKWLAANNIDFKFHDYRVDGINANWLSQLVAAHGWEIILNKRGTTYRQLEDNIKQNMDETSAIEQMLLAPAMIKRPILEIDGKYHVGFKDSLYAELFNK